MIVDSEVDHDIEDLIQREAMVVTVTHAGYIKRVALSTYRAQKRGGKGRAGMATKEGDFLEKLFICDTHTPVLFFSSRGMAYRLKVYRLPEATPQARGKALINLLPLEKNETITTIMPMPEDEAEWQTLDIMFRDRERQGPAQQAERFRERHGERQDRDEAGRGRPPGWASRPAPPTRTSCSRREAENASAFPSTRSGCSAAAHRPAFAG